MTSIIQREVQNPDLRAFLIESGVETDTMAMTDYFQRVGIGRYVEWKQERGLPAIMNPA